MTVVIYRWEYQMYCILDEADIALHVNIDFIVLPVYLFIYLFTVIYIAHFP